MSNGSSVLKARFRCDKVEQFSGKKTIYLTLLDNSDENKSFSSGQVVISTIDQNLAVLPGKEYYLNLSEA